MSKATTPPAYDQAKRRLVDTLRRMQQSSWSPTDEQRELNKLAEQLKLAADQLEFGAVWQSIEEVHDAQWAPGSTKDAIGRMRQLEESARRAAENLPNSRARPRLPWAALVFLHVRHRHGLEPLRLYDKHPAVLEFAALLTDAGATRAPETTRGLLRDALRAFDPHMPPAGLEDIA